MLLVVLISLIIVYSLMFIIVVFWHLMLLVRVLKKKKMLENTTMSLLSPGSYTFVHLLALGYPRPWKLSQKKPLVTMGKGYMGWKLNRYFNNSSASGRCENGETKWQTKMCKKTWKRKLVLLLKPRELAGRCWIRE